MLIAANLCIARFSHGPIKQTHLCRYPSNTSDMQRLLTVATAALLVIHGLIHLMGTVVYMQWGTIEGLTYKTTLLFGTWPVGDAGMRVFGALWLLPTIGFVACAVALVAGWAWWRPFLMGITLLSLGLTLLDWENAYAGVAVNLLILLGLMIGPRLTALLTG